MSKVRVLLADDHVLFRRGLAAILSADRQVQIVGEADDGQAAVAKAIALAPDVVLMDIQMPLMDGIEATRLLRRKVPGAKILILTVSDEDEALFEAVKAGAHGYLLKNVHPDVLIQAISGVVKGEAPLSGGVAARLLQEFAKAWAAPSPAPTGSSLTQRELEILSLVAGGASNKQIASRLVITEGTVKNHLHNILEKLHLRNRAEAAAYVTRSGLVGPPEDHPGPR